jgi:hypothetical protein
MPVEMRCIAQQGQTCDYSAEWTPEILAMICLARSLALVRLVPTQTSVAGMSIWHTNCLIIQVNIGKWLLTFCSLSLVLRSCPFLKQEGKQIQLSKVFVVVSVSATLYRDITSSALSTLSY